MSVSPLIAAAAGEFHYNTGCLQRAVDGLSTEQWLTRPDKGNHVAFIVGHVLWARRALVTRVGATWDYPGLEVFARGARLDPAASYPTPESLLAGWQQSESVLASALNHLTPDALAAPAPPGPPSPDGKLSGFIGVLAWHETYHLGQIAYLRCWLGQPPLFG
ncbi:MAG TPA: DinB family protein [Terracidiphilus sp.]|nr:DinB family protein [Terracidiphilus sp.]